MLKVGVQTKGILPEREVWEGFQMIRKAGFEKIDFNLDTFLRNDDIYDGKINKFFDYEIEDIGRFFLPYVEAMKHFGITASQMHAPYPVKIWGRGEQNDYMQMNVIPKSIVLAEFLGVPWVIIHPFKLQYELGIEEERRQNVEYFQALIPLLKNCNVKVCLENLYQSVGGRITEGVCADPDDAIWYIDTLNEIAGEELFGLCLDTGHLQLVKRDPYEFIKKLGHRLKCLHLHENDAKGDLHQMPYTFGAEQKDGQDWEGILRGLKEINFNGTLSFETFPCMNSFPKPIAETVLETIHEIGTYFAEEIGEPVVVEQQAKNIRIGMIGTGRIAKRFVQDAKMVSNVKVSWIFNPHIESAEKFAEANGVRCYTDQLEELLENVDAVYIAAPHETHEEYVRAALVAEKHVLCEKPMVFEQEKAKELFTLAKEKNCILREAVKTSYCPGYLAMIEMAKSGKIGEIRDVESCFSKLTATNLREMTDLNYGGSVTELGSYSLLPIVQLLGTNYEDISFHSIYAANGLDTYTKMMISYPNGMATAKMGLGVKSEGQLVIAGTRGYILSESPWWLTKKFEVRYEDSKKREVYEFPFEASGLHYELSEFATEIISGETTQKTGITAEESVAIAGMMERFLEKNKAKRNQYDSSVEKNVKIWAHRGCCMRYPENTLEAFQAAAELPQVTGIELDVQFTRDGEIVVTHDENVRRVTNGTKFVVEYTLAELKELQIDAGNGKTTTIPTLEEVLTLLEPYCKQNGLRINIELKTSQIRYEGIEAKTMELVKKHGLEQYIVYSSFWADSIKEIKKLDPTAQTGMLACNLSDCIKWAKFSGADALHPGIMGLDCEIPEDMKDMPVRAWNGEEPFFQDGRELKEHNLKKYAMFGVTEVFTNVAENY